MSSNESTCDVVIVGGGIVGLATALELQNRVSDQRIAIVEAESTVGQHQTGHNSGVLHSGIYYKPGSAKARLCRQGKEQMEAFCEDHKIPYDKCGKVIVATNEDEVDRLDSIAERAVANDVTHRRINTDELREIEPASAGLAALHVPETGIVNFGRACIAMAELFERRGGMIIRSFNVAKIDASARSVRLQSRDGRSVDCAKMVGCAGLRSDRVCRLAGGSPSCKIVPFRGEYYELAKKSESLCRNLIYPVPDPSFPFLGVHFTRMIDGGVECGPNAVLALSRHGYCWSDIDLTDLAETIRFRGFRKLAKTHWRKGVGEMHRSIRKSAFVDALRKLIPSIRDTDLVRGRSGVRAQAVRTDGTMVDDFLWEETDNAVHVLNAPSPAATASLAIGEQIGKKLLGK